METLLNERYRLLTQHGAGGMAVIYRAKDEALGRIVAVKILRPSLTKDETFLLRFRQEARAAARLAHPNIVTVHDFGHDGTTYYMVLEFVEGQDLKSLVRQEAPFAIPRAMDLAVQICAGVGYAHRAGLVHADVKPQNVLVTGEGIVKVTDFGIARAAITTSTPAERESVVWGSPHYFSPEQAQGAPPTPAADVYAIGVVLFEMLTGQLPFSGKDHQALALAHVQEEPPFASDINPEVPHNLSRIVQKIMAKEPSARYRTADQLGRILRSYRERGDQPTGASAAQPEAPPTVPAAPPVSPARPEAPPTAPAAGRQHQTDHRPPPAAHFPPLEAQPVPQPPSQPKRKNPGTVDWITWGLGVLALLFVLGLIPLWLQVYRVWGGG